MDEKENKRKVAWESNAGRLNNLKKKNKKNF